jgi:hypothetical protein
MDEHDPLLVDTGRGFSLQYRGRWLYSSRAPLDAPLQTARVLEVQAETLYVVPSPCLWHGAAELLARLPESSAVLGIESCDDLLNLASRTLPAPPSGEPSGAPDGRLLLSSASEALTAYRTLESSIAPARFRRVVEVRLSGGRALSPGVYDSTIAALDADIAIRYRNRLAMVRMGRLWTRNVIANLASMRWSDVSPLPTYDRPLVVCGAGPSLDNALPLLRTYRDSLTIMAVDTAAGALARAGIYPDLVVCLEAQIYNVADFLPLGHGRTRLVADLSSHPSSFRATDGPITLLSSQWYQSAFLARLHGAGLPLTPVPPLGSVGVLALHVARMMGSPILISGLDFAFSPGATHCSGSPADLLERRLESRTNKRTAAWAASYRTHTRRIDNGCLADPALAMYAALATSELAGHPAYDLREGYGARLPALPLDRAGLERLLKGYDRNRIRSNLQGGAQQSDAAEYRRIAIDFLRAELERAKDVALALRRGCPEPSLKAKLAEADFLYAHFPDPERVLALEHDALLRVSAEAAYWRGRLETAIGHA